MQRPILVPLDGSELAEQALPYAELLAGSACELILLDVWEDPDDEFRLQERHGDSCARLETAVGDPAEHILRVTEQLGARMIVMTTQGRGALGRAVFGSVADQVTRQATVPVMLIRPEVHAGSTTAPQIRRLLVPLDGSPLAARALPVALALAKQLHIPVHLITVVGSTNAATVELTLAAFAAEQFQESLDSLFTEAETRLSDHAEQFEGEGVPCSWQVLRGSPYFAIADAARPGDVIVMTGHGRGGIVRLVLGSVAEKLVREAPVPVILVPSSAQRADEPMVPAATQSASVVTPSALAR
jgi:nucleotide-binding universal stress UspA family protein